MRLSQKLVLYLLAAAVLPLGLVGFWLLRGSEVELARRIGREQRALAQASAELVSSHLLGAVDSLARSAELVEWERLTAKERRGALSLLYQQAQGLSAVALVNPDGKLLAEPVFVADGHGSHPGFAHQGLAVLTAAIPLHSFRGEKGQAAVSPAYRHSLGRMAALAIAVRLSGAEGSAFALAELGLEELSGLLGERASPNIGRIAVVDETGRVLASSDGAAPLEPLSPGLWEAVSGHLAGGDSASFTAEAGERLMVSAATVPGPLKMSAVVSLPDRIALLPVRAMRRTVLFSLGGSLFLFVGLGLLLSRGLTRRLEALSAGAEALGSGALGTRIEVEGEDEIAELALAFNRMGAELEGARGKLQGWNAELAARVDEATSDLRRAQGQLLEAQKLAAVGQLGAGVAHEINNPLAGILGNTQLLMLDRVESDPDFETLKKIEQSAKRCKEITQSLLRFSQQREHPVPRPLDLNAVARSALGTLMGQARGEGIAVITQLSAGPLTVNADPGHMAQVIAAILSNARTALISAKVKELRLVTRQEGAEGVVEVSDTGKGIRPEHLPRIFEPFFTTKDVWTNVGLGLSVAYRSVKEQGGRIEVESRVGQGTRFTVRLPRPPEGDA